MQGWTLTDPQALGDLRHVLEGESFVEIPARVLDFAKNPRGEEKV